jgi:hypothetical protein
VVGEYHRGFCWYFWFRVRAGAIPVNRRRGGYSTYRDFLSPGKIYSYMVLSIRCQDPPGMKRTCSYVFPSSRRLRSVSKMDDNQKPTRTSNPVEFQIPEEPAIMSTVPSPHCRLCHVIVWSMALSTSEGLITCIFRRVHDNLFHSPCLRFPLKFATLDEGSGSFDLRSKICDVSRKSKVTNDTFRVPRLFCSRCDPYTLMWMWWSGG